MVWLVTVLEFGGAIMVAFSICPSREGEFLTPWWSWGSNAVPVRFNRGLFQIGVLVMALGGVVGALR
jgi:hypothetical protein